MSIPRDNYIGEPNYPSPWTTDRPLEGLRDIDDARIVSLSPDVCLTPVGSSVVPIPYPVVDYCGHDEDYTPSVLFTDKKAMVLRSCTTHVHGDKPGTRKGIKSGTVEGVCDPIGYASQVRAEKSHVIRHLDRFWMNNKNTQGEAIFVRGTKTFPAPVDDDPVPGSLRWSSGEGEVMSDSSPEPLVMGAQYAQAAPATVPQTVPTPVRPAPVPRPPGQVIRPNVPQWNRPPPTPKIKIGRWVGRLGRFGRIATGIGAFIEGMWPSPTAMPWYDEMPQDDFERELFRKARELEEQGVDVEDIEEWFRSERTENARRRRQQPEERPREEPTPVPDTVTVTEEEENRRCPWIMICFKPRTSDYDPAEFARQLREQQTGMQSLTPTEFLGHRAAVVAAGSTDPFRNTPAARQAHRDVWTRFRSGPNPYGNTPLAALHQLDIVAGGYGDRFARVGPQRENGIMGNLWAQGRGVQGGDRLRRLEDHARLLQQNHCPRMNARFRVCEVGSTGGGVS
ncbi:MULTISPECIES: PAAR-like domain-containing protein [Rhizobium]|uniref:DUF4150 domain-containing protein n=1 Tax=Rhizobium changzhiense TaxID=2692317 RepID=A0ABR6A219_9HYPH|nr:MULTISPECIES: PAAR-like domain-containing protein [Rhizobium]MBA5800665.1 DUF4150 domain-containing protein [Rhizobium changzhiense]MDC7746535.1 DUF4150 domain-containing protein [Rhizobium sp. BC56]MDC9813477.1 DUF4150 domain-containing protein [Rhizobium sp. MC62]MDC9837160.1 DUF4150 domain-containing protein [Rhizobium sp. MJ37]NNU49159.1 DUF4150 domain-containing protein [Rhizobium changzhiense]